MDMFDFSCAAPGLFVDIDADDCAAADFRTSTYESNLQLIADVWSSVEFLKALPLEMRKTRAKYPDSVAHSAAPGSARILVIAGCGHNRILASKQAFSQTIDFLKS